MQRYYGNQKNTGDAQMDEHEQITSTKNTRTNSRY